MIIRPGRPADISAILEILNHEILHSTVLYAYETNTLTEQTAWFKQKQVDKLPVIVAETKGAVLGFGTFGPFRPWPAYQFTVEHSIYIDKQQRGAGAGKLLMAELIQLAQKKGYHTMIAGIDAANTGSSSFHEKFGFKQVGRLNQVGYKFDRWLDLIFMQLILK